MYLHFKDYSMGTMHKGFKTFASSVGRNSPNFLGFLTLLQRAKLQWSIILIGLEVALLSGNMSWSMHSYLVRKNCCPKYSTAVGIKLSPLHWPALWCWCLSSSSLVPSSKEWCCKCQIDVEYRSFLWVLQEMQILQNWAIMGLVLQDANHFNSHWLQMMQT